MATGAPRPHPTWTPLVTTLPIPDYDSSHSVEGGAAAGVLARSFGTDRISFQVCSLTLSDAADNCDGTSDGVALVQELLAGRR
jgi:hypothetical protein